MASKKMTLIVAQHELSLRRKPLSVDVPIEMIRHQPNAGAAFSLACNVSGLEDKEIYLAFQSPMDPGYFSKIKSNQATLSANLIREFVEIVGNKVYAEWIAFQVDSTLVLIRSEAERRADEALAALEKSEDENRLLRELLTGKTKATA